MKTEIKIGDRIVITEDYEFAFRGEKGTIMCITRGEPPLAISFDHFNINRHDINGFCKKGHGYYVPFGHVKPLTEQSQLDQDIQSLKGKYPQYRFTITVEDNI